MHSERAIAASRWRGQARSGLVGAVLFVALCANSGAVARADEARPAAALFSTAGAEAEDAGLDSVIQANLEQLGQVRVTVKPGLDLPAVQLALDCIQQTAVCLKSVAANSGVQVLIASSLERKAGKLDLTLLMYDARTKGGP